MQERCGATGSPSAWISITVFHVPCLVEPPAPNVTEKNVGFTAASLDRTASSLSSPSGVFGGKNSMLKVRVT